MDSATSQGNPDPQRIQTFADREGFTLTELVIEKEKLKMRIEEQMLARDQETKGEEILRRWQQCIEAIAKRLS
jgi:hypothetical protein